MFHTKTVCGETPEEMDEAVEKYLNSFETEIQSDVSPFVDQYGAADDGWYKATVVVEV
jgi:hypothetical protein